jgi:hypothetical protein
MSPAQVNDPERILRLGAAFRDPIERLIGAGKNVVVIYPVPEVGWDVPNYLGKAILYSDEIVSPLSTSYEAFLERSRRSYEQLDLLKPSSNMIRIYPEKLLCNQELIGRCVAERNGQPLYYDDDHLSAQGAIRLAEKVISAMEVSGWMARHEESNDQID